MDRAIGRLLRAVCVGDAVEIALELHSPVWTSPQVVRDTVDAAIYHRIVPLLAEALAQAPGENLLCDDIMRVYREQTSHVLRLESLFVRAFGALSEAGIAVASFKGPALAHCYYKTPAQRTYVDIDLLISSEDLDAANDALGTVGLLPTDVRWRQAVNSGYGEVTYLGSDQAMLDLHWHPIRETAIRQAFTWTTQDLLQRATIAPVAGMEVPVLDPEDMLIAVASHACYDGAYRLGWLVDVARIERSGRVRWDVLADRCANTGMGLPVQVVRDRARRTLGYPDQSRALARGTWRTLTAALAAVRPVEQTFGQVLRGGILYRSTRRTSGGSIAALATLMSDEVAKAVLTDPNHRWRSQRRQRDRELTLHNRWPP